MNSVIIEVTATSAEQALQIARSVPNFTLDESYTPVPMSEQGTFILRGDLHGETIDDSRIKVWSNGNISPFGGGFGPFGPPQP